MTTQIKFRSVALIASLLIISNSFSQVSTIENLESSLPKVFYNKSYIKVLDEFHRLFANAEDVNWQSLNENFLVTFSVSDLKHRVLLNQKGKLLYKITYGTEKLLPVEIRKMVKRAYVEFLITGTSLVEEEGREIWIINIEDDSNLVVVRVENNELFENLHFKRYH